MIRRLWDRFIRWLFGGQREAVPQFLHPDGKRHLIRGYIGVGRKQIVHTLCGEYRFASDGQIMKTRKAPSCAACLDRERTRKRSS